MDTYFKNALGIKNVPSAERLRQRFDEEKTYIFTKVVQVTERTVNKHRQRLLVPEIIIEGWWTNLVLPEEKIIALYQNRGLSEQFHINPKQYR